MPLSLSPCYNAVTTYVQAIPTYRGRRQTVLSPLCRPSSHPQKPFHRGYPAVFLSFRFFSFAPSPLLAPRNSITLETIDGGRSPGVHTTLCYPLKAQVCWHAFSLASLPPPPLSFSLSIIGPIQRVSFRPTVVPGSQEAWLQTFS